MPKKTLKKKKGTSVASSKKRGVTKGKTKKSSSTKSASGSSKSSSGMVKLPTQSISKKQTKAQIIADISDMTGLSKSDVKNLFSALRNLVERHLKGSGQISIPELGIKIRRVNKKATKARMGRNPFTGEEVRIAAKPARKGVRATVLKSLKEVL